MLNLYYLINLWLKELKRLVSSENTEQDTALLLEKSSKNSNFNSMQDTYVPHVER